MAAQHIVNAYDQELTLLHKNIGEMGRRASEQLRLAVRAIVRRDSELATQVLHGDQHLDELDRAVEQQSLRLLALRQPMARDLREVIAALKIASNLERIGDFAANVAKRAIALEQLPQVDLSASMEPMGRIAAEMVEQVIAAYSADDLDAAIRVRDRDEELDRSYTALFRELLTYMMESPQRITACTHLMFAAKNLERIGDHATNIAESVCFRIKGKLPEEERHKGDETAFSVLQPGAPEA